MTSPEIDSGVRCERHVGEVFPVRCDDCSAEAETARPATMTADEIAYLELGRPMPDSALTTRKQT